MTELVYRGKWDTLGKELENIIRHNNSKTKEERKPLNKIFEEFAENKDTTYNSASRYYYNEIKSRIEKQPTINIDESIENFTHSVTTDLRDPRDIYKIGDVIEVVITSIADYGVFAKSKEGFEGLIHISEITGKQYVDLPEDFFYIGEKVKVKIKRLENDGKMSLSTRAIGGKEKVNPAFKDIAKSSISETQPLTVKFVPKEEKVEPKEEKIEPKIEKTEHKPEPIQLQSNDRDNIIGFIKKYSDNKVSTKALADIDEMVSQFGVFQTTVSLMEAIRDIDISSYITEMTMEKLTGGDLLRRS